MNKNTILWGIVAVIVVALAFWAWSANQLNSSYPTTTGSATATSTAPAGGAAAFDKSVSDGSISLQYPSADFAVATNGQQILLNAVIPACDPDFDECLYYDNTSTFAGTNFESAGLRVEKRPDLTTQAQCLDINPSGYNSLSPTVTTSSNYAVSLFGNIGNGAAGNLSVDNIYRLAYNGVCYELDERVAQTQFLNYPSGTIQQFTSAEETNLQSEMQSILNTLTLPSGQAVTFTQA